MEPGHEMGTPATGDSTPLPIRVDALGGVVASSSAPPPAGSPATPPDPALPTAEAILRAIAVAEGTWFPARYAAAAGVARDSLDEPLAELRLAELIRVAEWVKDVGQGYVLTPEGQAAVKNPAELARLKQPAPAAPVKPDEAPLPIPTRDEEGADLEEKDELPREGGIPLRPPLVVPVLLMANALWFFVCAVVSIRWGLTPSRSLSEGHPDVLHRFGAVSGIDLLNGEWWRLITSCFVHIGVLHLIGNLFALAMMGPLAELLWGRSRLLLIYFISGLAGSALAMTLRPDVLLAGASGAIWGIQMSLFAWLFAFRRHLPPDLASDWFRRLGVVFVLNAGISFLPGVSWEGHLGGGVAGFLAAGLLNAARFGDQRRRISAGIMLAFLPLLFVGALAAAMDAKGMPGWQHLRQKIADDQQRHERAERQTKLREAQTEYVSQITPRLVQISPDAVRQTQTEFDAGVLLAMTKRTPERVQAIREKVESLKKAADEAVQSATREPTGVERFDQLRERAKAFAAERAKSFGLLLEMLASAGPPKQETWDAWQASRRESERLWTELTTK
jgi:membrane associated rhomboid family serine protease